MCKSPSFPTKEAETGKEVRFRDEVSECGQRKNSGKRGMETHEAKAHTTHITPPT